MTRSDVTLCSWNSPAHSTGNTGLYLSRSVSAKQSGWLQNLWTGAGTCVHCTYTCPRHQPLWPAATSHWHVGKHITKRHRQLAVGRWRKWLHASMKAKWHHFEHLDDLLTKTGFFQSHKPALFKATNSLPRKHVVSRHFHRIYLKANKVSKSEGTRKVEYVDHFWKCADVVDQKLSKLVHACQNYSLTKSARFFWDGVHPERHTDDTVD